MQRRARQRGGVWAGMLAAWVGLAWIAGCCPPPDEDGGGGVEEDEGGGEEGDGEEDNGGGSGGFTPPKPGAKDGNRTVKSFEAAKSRLPRLFAGHEETFYCGCSYEEKEIDLKSCGYKPRKSASRASRLEWEHVVPAHAFGQSFKEWRDGDPACVSSKGEDYKGRECAKKANPDFARMEADLYNLRPAIGEVNGDRANFQVGMIEGEARAYGACDVEIDFEADLMEPRPEVRGDVARTYLYMDWAYPKRGVVSRKLRPLLEAWSKSDPPDKWEREWAKRVEKEQGNRNPFIR